jgi:hypothetical protein
MKYWDEMLDKYGFSDGEAVPDGAAEHRAAYVFAVNAIAEENGSKFRVVDYDRPGCHNWCMIMFEPDTNKMLDVAMRHAIDSATELGVDDFVHHHTYFNRNALIDALTNRE